MKLAPVLKLVRLSALPSAWADQFGGMALALALAPVLRYRFEPSKLVWLLPMSLGIYLGGMALNDVLHVRKDRLLHKPRPIVTGDIKWTHALIITVALFGLGVGCAFAAGCGVQALILVGLVIEYNRRAAGRIVGVQVVHDTLTTWFSVVIIAACRGVHVCLPFFAHSPSRIPVVVAVFFGCVFVYFCLVTVVSLFEDSGGGRKALLAVSVLLLPAVLALPVYLLNQPGTARSPVLGIFVPLLVLAFLLMTLWRKLDTARSHPTPPKLGACVGAGIRGEALLMCGFALMLAHDQPWWGLAALAMYPTGAVLSKWISPT
ncbi:MAG: hypothetical protein H6839_00745 [Planctomycetes bacterium]|nr:hypothetical protein [Planctomycetota bacterium]